LLKFYSSRQVGTQVAAQCPVKVIAGEQAQFCIKQGQPDIRTCKEIGDLRTIFLYDGLKVSGFVLATNGAYTVLSLHDFIPIAR
jgi:hypothetical protein